MRVAIAQMNSRPGDFARTASRMVEQSRVAVERGAQLVVFPLPVLTGPDPGGTGEWEGYLQDLLACLDDLAARLACPALVPFALSSPEGPYLEAVLVADGRLTPLAPIGGATPASVGGSLAPGDPAAQGYVPRGVTVGGIRLAVAFDQEELRMLADSGVRVDAICYLESRCLCADDETCSLTPSVAGGAFVADAARSGAWIVAVGAVGGYGLQVFCGGSFVMAPWGELAWAAPSFEEALGVADVDPLFEGPLASPVAPAAYQRLDHLWDALVLALRDYCGKQGIVGAALPLGGDVCTAALAALAVDALGPANVHAVICQARDDAALEDARSIARALRVRVTELQDGALHAAAAALGLALPAASADAPAMRRELSHATLRWMAGREGAVVLSAADKTSLALDPVATHVPGAHLAPFGDVYRTDVICLLRRRNARSAVVPPAVLARQGIPGGAELSRLMGGASAEDFLNRIDAILYLHVERVMPLGEVMRDQGDEDLVRAVLGRLDACEGNRRSAFCYPLVSERTLFERRSQLVNAWSDVPRAAGGEAGERLVAMVSAPYPMQRNQGPSPVGMAGAVHLSDEASMQVEGILGMIQDMLQDGSWQDDGIWGDGLFSEN